MVLQQIFDTKSIKLNLESETKDEVFEELIELIVAAHPEMHRGDLLRAVQERESKMSTGIIHGIAVPHGKCASVKGIVGALGISQHGIDYDALDDKAVHLVFMLITDPNDHEYHLSVLKHLSLVLDSPMFVSSILEKTSAQDVFDAIRIQEEHALAAR